ncbi:HET-domain-containing protein [Aspergillus ellipticus CBS 707.79]|uniref:HET-domain-containing protein n=1 Tax=Aspergillus ellipticus CBS 707.79 TaxID=1448320 RepID=A0A319D1I9_9EURO|nr:HET-domain-containing protein [Aspergillus ellipticus CBS 707.79]
MIELPQSRCFERNHLPATIKDALLACERLGYQYIWIDQLCIDQSNESEVQEQISQMHRIYQHAICTLVALEGESSSHGLPGVAVPRSWQRTVVEFSGVGFADPCPALSRQIRNSEWWNRGWTLQEGLYSSYLLFFTEYGIYYADPSLVGIQSDAIYQREDEDIIVPKTSDYWGVLSQYTGRNLSYQSDILRAFTAVLQATHGDRTYCPTKKPILSNIQATFRMTSILKDIPIFFLKISKSLTFCILI